MFTKAKPPIRQSPLILPLEDNKFPRREVLVEIEKILIDDINYPRKVITGNTFKKVSPYLNSILKEVIEKHDFASSLIWHFEIFSSDQATGLHNDRNLFIEQNELCQLGLIIPLKMKGSPHLTRFYDLFIEEKVNWDGEGNFRKLDKSKVEYDKQKLQKYQDAFWEEERIIFFDSCQIHEAIFPSNDNCFKLSLNGLGYKKIK